MNLKPISRRIGRLVRWMRPAGASDNPVPYEAQKAFVDRRRPSELLSFRDYDKENDLIVTEDAERVSLGFILRYIPLLVAGTDAEPQVEAIINACPQETILQFGVLSTPHVKSHLDQWTWSRLEKNRYPVLAQATQRRRDYVIATQDKLSMLEGQRFHARDMRYYLTVTVPFLGDIEDTRELDAWRQTVIDLRETVIGAFRGAGIYSYQTPKKEAKQLLKALTNPHKSPTEIFSDDPEEEKELFAEGIVQKNTRWRVRDDGTLGFSGIPGASKRDPKDIRASDHETVASVITVDAYPSPLYLPMTSGLLGMPTSQEDRITAPFWLFTNIHVLNPDIARERLTRRLGALNKQAMSESDWYKAMMAHLYERREAVETLIKRLRKGSNATRFYTGIVLFSNKDEVKRDTEYVCSLWRRAGGFRASAETMITLPVYLSAIPGQYTPLSDTPQHGLQRARTSHSLNAASLAHLQGDWAGTPAAEGGPLLFSRRGQIASMNLLNTTTNMNFTITATSGGGKSFFADEIASDFLSKGGLVRIIDVGYSYQRFCETVNGMNLVFDPEDPKSINPFWGMEDERELAEMLPILKDMVRQMAYPLLPEEKTPQWEYQLIEAAIYESWHNHRGHTEMSHLYEWLKAHADKRAHDLADQLASFAIGRLSPWFNGPREIQLDNQFVVIELERLNADPELRFAVMTLMIGFVSREMYLTPRDLPKILVIDEAWDLLGNVKTARFIETAFRRARKYNGIAGIITQGFADYDKSPAARAAFDNAAWQFVLKQKPESLEYARDNKLLITDDYLFELLKTVHRGEGYSEVYVRSETGQGLYRFVVDQHSYYTYTTKGEETAQIDRLIEQGMTTAEAIDHLAKAAYRRRWGV